MSSSGSNSPVSACSSGSTDQKVEQLIKQLKNLLPELRNTPQGVTLYCASGSRDLKRKPTKGGHLVPQTVVLEETCSRLRSLEKEVDDLKERVVKGRVEQLLATVEKDKADAVRRLLYKA
ncbi:transcription factor ILI6-like [Nymphaea colorata]|uniref:transcription factor ILI6-like n=1 Tax=Nymphaea colorata TaxID=210225 RepID=UPI00129D8237|nr:transcription factor ILI6-like [Nymphaea colorata]